MKDCNLLLIEQKAVYQNWESMPSERPAWVYMSAGSETWIPVVRNSFYWDEHVNKVNGCICQTHKGTTRKGDLDLKCHDHFAILYKE